MRPKYFHTNTSNQHALLDHNVGTATAQYLLVQSHAPPFIPPVRLPFDSSMGQDSRSFTCSPKIIHAWLALPFAHPTLLQIVFNLIGPEPNPSNQSFFTREGRAARVSSHTFNFFVVQLSLSFEANLAQGFLTQASLSSCFTPFTVSVRNFV